MWVRQRKKKIMEKWQNGKKGIERAKTPRRNKDQTLQAIYKNRNDANWSWNRCMLHDSSSLFDIFVCSNICSWLGVNLMFDSFALFNCGRQFFAPATLFFWGTLKKHTIVFATCLHVQNKCMYIGVWLNKKMLLKEVSISLQLALFIPLLSFCGSERNCILHSLTWRKSLESGSTKLFNFPHKSHAHAS